MSKGIRLFVISGIFLLFVVFILGGFFIVSDEAIQAVEGLWVMAVGGLIVFALAALGLGLIRLGIQAYKDALILPDENGNFPVSLTGKNYNLSGVERRLQSKAWLGWQLTNNKGGSIPSTAFSQLTHDEPDPTILALPVGNEIIDENQAPPIILDARSRAMEM